MSRTDAILKLAEEKSKRTYRKALEAIEELVKNGEKVSFYNVYKRAGISKSFVYNNENIRDIIMSYRGTNSAETLAQDSRDTIIAMQKRRIADLERQCAMVSALEKTVAALKAENAELKKQLKTAYTY